MAKLQPFRDGTLQDKTELRIRLNEVVKAINETSLRVSSRRIANVQSGMQVVTASPGFTVGAITLGGVNPTNGGAKPTAAPWLNDWVQQGDGRITFIVSGLGAAPSLYSVNVVFYEQEPS
jgi:hypothetical protein